MIIPHGWPKLMMGRRRDGADGVGKRGIAPAEPWRRSHHLETVGGWCVAWSVHALFRRSHHHRNGRDRLPPSAKFGWTGPGYEYPLMGAPHVRVALRGGGPWSLDRKLGWQL